MMKRFLALLLCLCMALSLTACGSSDQAPAADTSASASASAADTSTDPGAASSASGSLSAEAAAPAVVTGDPAIALEKAEDAVMGDDGTVLVNYEYQRAIITLPNAEAMQKVQADLDRELQIFLDYNSGETADFARDALSYSQEATASASTSADAELYAFQPYYGQYTITPSRVDEKVVSLVVDNVSYTGGAHGSDNRYCLNYDARTGERLTFAMLSPGFRARAEKLVLSKAAKSAEMLDEGYESQIPFVVSDGTESADEVNRRVYPDLYADTSIEPEAGTLNAEFYLNKKGVMFIAGEYVMKAYAAGIMEFGIPYSKFNGYFNEEYLPEGYEMPKEKESKKDKKDKKDKDQADADKKDKEESASSAQ